MSYAENTSVSVEKSRAELDGLLRKAGAGQRGFFDNDETGEAIVAFTLSGRQYRIAIPLPKLEPFLRSARSFRGRPAKEVAAKHHEQACRARWRAVVLVVKAKLELIALGVSVPEREFLADLVLPDGTRLHDRLKLAIADTYDTGRPLLLPEGEVAR